MKNSAAVELSNSEQIKLALERLDEVATGYEKKWGVDRLINLVDQDLAERFQEQLELLNFALERHAALDAAAESRGCARIDSAAWEVVTAGRKIAFVSDIRAYKTLQRDGWEIWSAEEVGRIIDKFHVDINWNASEAVRQTKRLFPGAEINCVRPNKPAALDDALPF